MAKGTNEKKDVIPRFWASAKPFQTCLLESTSERDREREETKKEALLSSLIGLQPKAPNEWRTQQKTIDDFQQKNKFSRKIFIYLFVLFFFPVVLMSKKSKM